MREPSLFPFQRLIYPPCDPRRLATNKPMTHTPCDPTADTLPPPTPTPKHRAWPRVVVKLFYGLMVVLLGCVWNLPPAISINRPASPVPMLGPGREVVLWIDPSFSLCNQQVLTDAYTTREILEHLGVTVVYSMNGQQDRPTISDRVLSNRTPTVYVYNWLNTNPDSNVLGLYPLTRNRLYLDETRISSPRMFRTVFLHEFGHWAGLKHVCLTLGELAVTAHECTPGITGPAIMNPGVTESSPEGFTSFDDAERRRSYPIPTEPTRTWDRDLGQLPEDATLPQ